MARAIIHLDMDAFYASVEQRDDPSLRRRPVIVGGGRNPDGTASVRRGVVSAASYEARPFGVRSGMPLATALRLCPGAVLRPVNFPAYRDASAAVFAVMRRYTPVVEPASLDEAYLDVTGSLALWGSAEEIGRRMQSEILEETGLTASLGIATSKTVAKVASDLRKPHGFVVVPEGSEAEFLAPLPLRRLPGLGPRAEEALTGLGLATLGDLQRLPRDILERRLGKSAGGSIWTRARGADSDPVRPPEAPKSISREETFDVDVADRATLERRLGLLAADVGRRLRAQGLRAGTVHLKLKRADFSLRGVQTHLADPTDTGRTLEAAGRRLLGEAWGGEPIRLIGIGASGLTHEAQLDLFATDRNDAALEESLDRLRQRFGDNAVRRGTDGLRDLDFRGDDLARLAAPKEP